MDADPRTLFENPEPEGAATARAEPQVDRQLWFADVPQAPQNAVPAAWPTPARDRRPGGGVVLFTPIYPCEAWLWLEGWAGCVDQRVRVLGATPKRLRIQALEQRVRLAGPRRWLEPGEVALVPKTAVVFSGAGV